MSGGGAKGAGRSLVALLAVVFVAMTGFGIFIPVFPFLGLVLDASATEITIAMGAYSLGQLLAAPAWGRLSDRIGRKPVLVLGLFGAMASYFAIAFADSIWQMGVARLFGGLMAGNIGAAFAAAADLADERTRARNMGFLAAAFGFGFIVGPALGAFTVGADPDWGDYQRVCLYAAGFAAMAAFTAWFLFTETRAAPARTAAAAVGEARGLALLRGRPVLARLALVMFLVIMAQALMESVISLWADETLGWGVREVGFAFAAVGLISVGLQGGGAGPLARRFGEGPVLMVGLGCFVAGFILLSFAATGPATVLALLILAAGAGFATPALQSLIAAQAGPDERGAVMGLGQSASALGRVMGPIAAGPLYDGLGPTAPFLLGAGLLAAAGFAIGLGQRMLKPG